jgi:two-component system NarL family sensor kinase
MAGEVGLTQGSYLIIGTAVLTLMMLAIIGFALAFQRKLARKAEEFREIEKLVQKQELQSAYFVIEGQEHERKRIAAELHDNIGGLLATLKIYSDLSLNKDKQEDIDRLNHKINEVSITLGEEVRKLSHELDLRTLAGFGLKVAVEHLSEAITASGKLSVMPVIDMQRPVAEGSSLHLYRIIQELLTNTLKHSNATIARIELTQIDEDITLIYEDNGQGFDLEIVKKGMGLQNIQTRAGQVGGKLTLDSSPNGTTCIIEITNHG